MIAITYIIFTIVLCVLYGKKIEKLEERIKKLEGKYEVID